MKKLSLLILMVSTAWMNGSVAQTITVGANSLNLPCGGGNVDLTALGNPVVPVFGDDFNIGGVAPGWTASPAAQFDNPCGASADGTTYLWMGPTTAAPRELTTAAVDVSCGGTVCFDFKFMPEGGGTQNAPCEGVDLYNEGVSLQCSTDGGATWTDLAYFAPNGDLLASYPGGVTGPVANGPTAFTTWGNYCFNIPAGCQTTSTKFQLHQWGSSGPNFDHWGIDNFFISSSACAPYYYDWLHIPGSPDAADVTTNVTATTTFTCCFTDGVTSVCDDVTITVDAISIDPIAIGTEPCLGDNAGTATISIIGGSPPINYVLSGPSPSSNGTGNFTNLVPGNYTVNVTDNSGCTAQETFIIVQGPSCCTLTATSTDVLCFGQTSGTGTANPANGVAPYSYLWDAAAGGQTTQTASNLPAGTYSVTITDFNGCTETESITVDEPAILNCGTTPADPSCFGVCDGQIAVTTPTGGTPGYQYNLNGGAFGGASTFVSLCDGTYNIIVQDASGCEFTINNVILNEPIDVTLAEVSANPETCSATNGSLTVVAGGGTPPYQYDIGGGQQVSPTFTNLAAGPYTVTVSDVNNCTETILVTVGSSPEPLPFVDVLTDVACAGAFTGSATIGVGGGVAPYTFILNPPGAGQASNTFNSVPAGGHIVEVVDANGCTGTVDVIIDEPSPLTFISTPSSTSCNGTCDGQINITASNATPPYMYSDDNGLTFQVSNILTDLCTGNVNVVVSDGNGCLANDVVVVNEPAPLTIAPSFTEPSCFGLHDGTITFGGVGGTPAFSYSVDKGVTFSGIDPVPGIAGGNYDLVIEDANGCQTTDNITVTQPPQFGFNFIANNPSNCGAQDGSFEIAAVNGLGPYFYSIDGNVTQQFNDGFFLNLFSGLYELVVTDANGCQDSVFSALSDNVMITQTDLENPATCFNGCDGTAIVSQTNGSPPYNYTLNTSGANQPVGVFGGLCAGQYFITIEDNGACIGIQEVNISQPDSIIFAPATVNITCPNGADGQIDFGIVVGGNGGPYTYSIDNGATFFASDNFSGLTSGQYYLVAMDGSGCLGGMTITLTEPAPWDVVMNTTDLTCFQNNTGFVQVIGGGSTAPYSYSLGAAVNPTGVFALLAASPPLGYPIQVTDVNGCTFDTIQIVNEPLLLTATYAITDALCNGSLDGQIEVAAAGGTPPYAYSSDNGVIFQSGNVLAGLGKNCHDVLVEDDNNCQVISTECVNEPSLITMTMVMNPATCGNNNADVTITALGGTPGYQYSNDNGVSLQAGNVFAGLAPTDFTIVVEDLNGCQIDSLITLTSSNTPTIDNVVANDPLCFGSADGDITVTSSGGIGAHTYSLNIAGPYNGANTFSGLTTGVYDVYVQDANSCIVTQQVVLTDPPLLTLAPVPTHLSCNGDFSGEIVIFETGGTSPYQYSIDNGINFQAGGKFSFVPASLYNLAVEDANGCQATGNVMVNEPLALNWTTFTITDPICFEECTGAVNTVVVGGTPGFSYNWSSNIAGNTEVGAVNVCGGTYSLTVTDANGCTLDSNDFVLTDPAEMFIDGAGVTDVLCFGGNTGTITIGNVVNGIPPYDYSIDGGSNFQTGPLFGDVLGGAITAGNYDLVVQDANGCQAFSSTIVSEPDLLQSTAPSDWTSCFNEVGVIQAFSTGGSEPYTYNWTNDINPTVETAASFDHNIVQTVAFTLVVTDANGCVANPVSYTVTPTPPLALTPTPDTSICLGDVTVLGIGVTGGQLIDFGHTQDYGYAWTPGTLTDTLSTFHISPSVPTTYTITVMDLCGEVVDTTITVGINPDPIVPIVGPFTACAQDTMDFDISAYILPGYTVLWDLGNGDIVNISNPTEVIYEFPGTFDMSITITTDLQCTVTQTSPAAVEIYNDPNPGFYFDPASPSVLDPSVQIVDISSNVATYSYTFSGFGTSSDSDPFITFPVEEEITVQVCQRVISPDGCPAEICIPLDIHEEVLFYVPNTFSPDGDAFNETFFPVFTSGVDPYQYHLTVFNRWGETLFESFNYGVGWNGRNNLTGQLVKDGVYIWQIEFREKLSERKQTNRGHITLLK